MIREANANDKVVRCAIYTRKSTEDGLEQEFNSLDAQRDAGEAFIASQRHESWECLPTKYDDGGYTGGNLDRPAMQRLMADIDAGKIDCVVVYKVDRLSRSLMDFSRVMEKFDNKGVAFVSVTQQFNTASSMGRLILNVLLSFAQFEREMISERTRDKIAAARRRGKWSGGMPLLGYNVIDTKLVVIPEEAERVRQIFSLYLEHGSLLDTAKAINERGWRTKQWTTKKGTQRGGKLFDKTNVHTLLINPTYIGKVRYRDEVHEGEHQAIVDTSLFTSVQKRLKRNGRGGHEKARNQHAALLRSVLRCKQCDRAMVHNSSTKRNRRYRYYVCGGAQKRGHASCPTPSIPADQIESFVIGEIKAIAADHELIADIHDQTQFKTKEKLDALVRERESLIEFLRSYHGQLNHLAITSGPMELVADLQTRITQSERRHAELNEQIESLEANAPRRVDIVDSLNRFDELWASMKPRDRNDLVATLVDRVDYDGVAGTVDIHFHTTGITTLGQTNPEPSS
ncbi:recombinase family protein [Crateriforma conspicua]|uniref:recombinase family protein n=1 Tax=Crateriforma conspicua TaxID=2527996 RepID=UPI00118A8AEC|nr:recombinase family protein [Crateriforma conspicua]QDV62643.1 DNA-invertase hin [Crateriforma conspicua]